MALRIKSFAPLLCAMLTLAPPALADVTPEEVWQNWQDSATAMGQTVVAASAARDGDSLIIDNVTIASAANGVTAEGSIAQILMQDQGDGTVLVTLSPEYPVKMRLPPAEAGQGEVEVNILVTQTDLEMLASGTASDIRYDIIAPMIKVKLDRAMGAEGNLAMEATMTDVSGIYALQQAEGGQVVQSDLSAKGLAMVFLGANPAEGAELRATLSVADIAMTSEGQPLGAALATGPAATLMADLNSVSAMSNQSGEFLIEMDDPTGLTTIEGRFGAGDISTNITAGVMDYTINQSDTAVTVTSPSLPLPDVSLAMQRAALTLTLPLAPSESAQPLGLTLNVENLAPSEGLWSLFDPSAALPRDPIQLVLDMDGTAVVNALPDAPDAPPVLPAELQTMSLNALRIEVAGAVLTGAGSSTFSPDENGLPSPNAKLDFTLIGANGLMDKLVASGLISAEALTFPRMMLAMVANAAADGSDTLTSTVEIIDKSVSANGQILYQLP